MDTTQQQYQTWKNQIKNYQKNKRTKKPFGKQFVPNPEIIHDSDVRLKQRQFNPVLQIYESPQKQIQHKHNLQQQRNKSLVNHLKSAGRNYRPYDIINLHGDNNQSKDQQTDIKGQDRKDIETVRKIYNPINNKQMPQFYFSRKRVNLPPNRPYRYLGPNIRQFDIVKCRYRQNNSQKMERDLSLQNLKINQKYQRTHQGYNPVLGKYYNQQKQEIYDNNLMQSQLLQSSGVQFNKRFPPTYIARQPVILDREKPPTDSIIALDRKRSNAKQRFKLKYIIQEQYNRRNKEDFQKKEAQVRNRVHNSGKFQNIYKQFHNLDLGRYSPAQSICSSKRSQVSLDDSQKYYPRSYSSRQETPMSIKSRGFY